MDDSLIIENKHGNQFCIFMLVSNFLVFGVVFYLKNKNYELLLLLLFIWYTVAWFCMKKVTFIKDKIEIKYKVRFLKRIVTKSVYDLKFVKIHFRAPLESVNGYSNIKLRFKQGSCNIRISDKEGAELYKRLLSMHPELKIKGNKYTLNELRKIRTTI